MTRPAVEVCFAPRDPPGGLAVVVDVLRATSTIVQALAAGYPRVLCCGSDGNPRARPVDGSGQSDPLNTLLSWARWNL